MPQENVAKDPGSRILQRLAVSEQKGPLALVTARKPQHKEREGSGCNEQRGENFGGQQPRAQRAPHCPHPVQSDTPSALQCTVLGASSLSWTSHKTCQAAMLKCTQRQPNTLNS